VSDAGASGVAPGAAVFSTGSACEVQADRRRPAIRKMQAMRRYGMGGMGWFFLSHHTFLRLIKLLSLHHDKIIE
jgi:hypothetical protein